MAKKPSRTTTQAQDGQIIVGIKKDLLSVLQLPLGGETFTPTSLMAFVQSRIDAANEVGVAKAKYIEATKTYQAINIKGTVVVHGLKQYLMNAYGKTSPLLADFGFAPPKTATLTAEQKQAAVLKRAATRKARGTVGPKKKLAVTGETVKIAALQAAVQQTAATAAPTAAPAPAPVPAPVPVLTLAPTPAPQPAPVANGAPPAVAPPKA